MRCQVCLPSMALAVLLFVQAAPAISQQDPAPNSSAPRSDTTTKLPPGTASLRISLRLEDESPFKGFANVHVFPNEGYEVAGTPTGSDGEILFEHMQPGTYTVQAVAPGFLSVRLSTTIENPQQQRTLFVIMLPKLLPAASTSAVSSAAPSVTPSVAPSAIPANAPAIPGSWLPAPLDDVVPDVEPDVECPSQQILRGVGQRTTQFISDLEKFSATERVEHIDLTGTRRPAEVRNFEYVVIISRTPQGMFAIDEFRNGSVDPEQFPAHIATDGLPAMVLIFHPLLASDFRFQCEGLGQWRGKPAWQVHFSQRPDKPSRIRAYIIAARHYRIPLKGRVWIDPGTFQVLQLDSELVDPIKEIELTHERSSIEYGLVQFHSQKQEIWLAQTANLWVERKGHRYYRRHTFSNFKVFSVDTTQTAQRAKESYTFTNTSDRDLLGVLTVKPAVGTELDPVTISFTIPAGGSILKFVGPGKDVNVPVGEIASAVFVHNGKPESIKVDAHLLKESSLDVVPDTPNPSIP
jgi:hypothetical protein